MSVHSNHFFEDCLKWRGKILDGYYAHWCYDWDELPVDENTHEIDCCHCFDEGLKLYKTGYVSLFFDFEPFYWGA